MFSVGLSEAQEIAARPYVRWHTERWIESVQAESMMMDYLKYLTDFHKVTASNNAKFENPLSVASRYR